LYFDLSSVSTGHPVPSRSQLNQSNPLYDHNCRQAGTNVLLSFGPQYCFPIHVNDLNIKVAPSVHEEDIFALISMPDKLTNPSPINPPPWAFQKADSMQKKTIAFIILLCLVVGFWTMQSGALASSTQLNSAELAAMGYLDVTQAPYNADPAGKSDATAAIQQAMDDGYTNRMAIFLPEGTYKISNTLEGMRLDDAPRDDGVVLIGSTAGARPILKLVNSAPGFNNPDEPKALIHFWAQRDASDLNPDNEQASVNFTQTVRGIDLEIGSGNSGAVGVRFSGSQQCALENMRIDLSRGGFAGLYNLIGQAAVPANIEIIGGMYGIYANYGRFPGLIGFTLRNQTEYAVYYRIGDNPLTMAGFKIIKESAPAIYLESNNANNSRAGGNLNLIDGSIEFELNNGKPAIDNSKARQVYLNNVYFNNAGEIIQSGGRPAIPGGSGWQFLREYYHALPDGGLTLIDGTLSSDAEESTVLEGGITPPEDLLTRHLPPRLPSFEDEHVINVRDYGVFGDGVFQGGKYVSGHDDTAALQHLIDNPDIYGNKLFLPMGHYLLSDTLVLGENTQLFGAGKNNTYISALNSWDPVGKETPLLTTIDSASATTLLMDIKLRWPTDEWRDTFNALIWRAGKDSTVIDVHFIPHWTDRPASPYPEVVITGNGGGRWYGVMHAHNSKRDYPGESRRLLVEGTSQPLIFYNLEIEDSTSDWQSEIRNARNVAIYGFKTENHNVLLVNNSTNIALIGSGGANQLKVLNSNSVLMTNLNPQNKDPERYTGYLLEEEYFNEPGTIISPRSDYVIAVFKRGEVDFGAIWPGDHPPPPTPTPSPEPVFDDVPADHPYSAEIEALYNAGFTDGCQSDPLLYCPDESMTRAESAVFIERGLHGAQIVPPIPESLIFEDVPLENWSAKWISYLLDDEFTSGCSSDPPLYCPWVGHTRVEGTVFYLRMLNGPEYSPPSAEGIFSDLDPQDWGTKWAEQGYLAGLIPSCGENPLRFCADAPLTRGLAAFMMVQSKDLPLASHQD
jgi:hypothetical protein